MSRNSTKSQNPRRKENQNQLVVDLAVQRDRPRDPEETEDQANPRNRNQPRNQRQRQPRKMRRKPRKPLRLLPNAPKLQEERENPES